MGILNAKGKYIVRMDPDDTFNKDKINLQLKYMRENNADICFTNMNVNNKLINYPKTKLQIIKKLGLGFNPIAHASVIYKRELFTTRVVYNEDCDYAEDFDLWVKALINSKKFVHFDKPLTNYSIDNTINKTRNNAKAQIRIRSQYIVKLALIIVPLFTGLICNLFRLFIPFHYSTLYFFGSKKK